METNEESIGSDAGIEQQTKNQTIIDNNIKIQVLAAQGRMVKFGISLPAGILVHRQEIYKKMQQRI
jgi:carbon storage regulator CsrA